METKYKRAIFIALGVTFVLMVATIVVWKLKFYDDLNAQISTTSGEYTKAKEAGNGLPKQLQAQALAKEKLTLAQEQIGYLHKRFRSLSFDLTSDGSVNRTWIGYMNEYFADYGLNLRRQLVQAADETGVVLNTSLKVDAPPQMPENVAAPPNGLLKPVTGSTLTVTVTGDLPSILRFLERINRSPILMTLGAIKLEVLPLLPTDEPGRPDRIQASFTLTPYLVATGPSVVLKAPTTDAAAPGANATATATLTP